MKKRYLWNLISGGLILSSLPLSVISCSNQDSEQQKDSSISNFVEKNDRISVIETNSSLNYDAIKDKKGIKIALINGSGNTLDKSFNQSHWEALIKLSEDTRKDDKNQIEITDINPGTTELTEVYNNALEENQKVWVLAGYNHSEKIKAYLKNEENVKKLNEKGVIIIAVDFQIGLESTSNFKNLYEVTFNINEAAYIVGNALSKAFAKTFPGQNNSDSRKSGVYGGGSGSDVVSFISGYLKGILKYNKSSETTNKINQIDQIALNAGYEAGDPNMNQVTIGMIDKKPKFVLPVVAGGVAIILDEIQKRNLDMYVIGVDVDQSKAYPQHKGKFATSIQKNIGQAVYDVINEFVFGIKNKSLESKASSTEYGSKHLHGNFSDKWVAYAPSTASNEKLRLAINNELEKTEKEFLKLTNAEKDFISNFKDSSNKEYSEESLSELVEALVKEINK
ncbi:ABC transporter xylose-binding lipoprotein [Mycoplasmopsis canis UF31]|uniref:BMP family ABC transporter substrate-binding protein n=1 Tax=Mycoplasmopsis canis TaxID=29555 RepID=UPI00025ACFC2|nr:BMP family ABC transporter substrate-binding protein [Mycoplasmopsis canis]EIE39640.1 ABC transporter xylose-binding lipoprotein [Mycoplasmopsis canis UF31]